MPKGEKFYDFLFVSLDDKRGKLKVAVLFPQKIYIQSNFNGSNTFGTMKISSRQR